MKNKKGQMTVIIMMIGFSVLLLLLVTATYTSSLSTRGVNQLNGRQLDELTEGTVYYAIAYLKDEIDYKNQLKSDGTISPEPLKYDFNIKDSTGYLKPTISIYQESNGEYNATLSKQLFETGAFTKSIYLNTAKNACFQVNWDKDPSTGTYATVRFEVDRVYKNADGTNKIISVQLPVEENDGQIGMDPNMCTDDIVYRPPYGNGSAENPSSISSKIIYDINDANGVYMKNGYGEYRIKVSVVSGSAPNLQTSGIYYRLSNRTFVIKADSGYGNYNKNNINAIVKFTYTDDTSVNPKYQIIKWNEGDE